MSAHSLPPAAAGGPVVAIDVGGTTVKAAAIDAEGRFSPIRRVPSPTPGEGVVDGLVDLVVSLDDELSAGVLGDVARELTGLPPLPIGLAVPGIVDDDAGIGRLSANLGWRDAPLRDLVAQRTGSPVALLHDVRASALAEFTCGAGAGLTDGVVITIGTGIAAAVRVGGRMVVREGFAGEIGHVAVVPDGDVCACGGRGCLEQIASARAIALRYAARSGTAVSGARDVLRLMRAGDCDAAAVWQDAVEGLATAIAVISSAIAPQAFILAGGLSEAGDALLAPLRAAVDARFPLRTADIRRATLGQDAGLVGAALAARALAVEVAAR